MTSAFVQTRNRSRPRVTLTGSRQGQPRSSHSALAAASTWAFETREDQAIRSSSWIARRVHSSNSSAATSAHLELSAAPVPGGGAAFASLAYGGVVISPWDAAGGGVLRLPSGRLVRGRGLRRALPPGPGPTFAVYLLGKPPPAVAWEARWVRWPDFWLPGDQAHARRVLHEAWERALTERVEIACPGGRGRTGTALACLAIIDGLPPEQAVAFVRQHYDPHAVETPWQKRYAAHFPIPGRSG